MVASCDRAEAPLIGRRALRGFTLAESLLAAVVLALAVVAVASTFSASHAQTLSMQTDSIAVAMARQLMEEIASKPLLKADLTPGWPVETDRTHYDSVKDYDGYSDGTPLRTLEGTTVDLSNVVPFTRQVTVSEPATLFGSATPPGDFVIVEVRARDVAGNGCELHRLVARTTLVR